MFRLHFRWSNPILSAPDYFYGVLRTRRLYYVLHVVYFRDRLSESSRNR